MATAGQASVAVLVLDHEQQQQQEEGEEHIPDMPPPQTQVYTSEVVVGNTSSLR